MAISMALHVCDTTRLYGFGPPLSGRNGSCARYFDACRSWEQYTGSRLGVFGSGGSLGSADWHDWRAERRWISSLRAHGIGVYVTG